MTWPKKAGVSSGVPLEEEAASMRAVVRPARKMEKMAPRVPPIEPSMTSVKTRKKWTSSPSEPRPCSRALRVAWAPRAHVSPQSPSPTIYQQEKC